MVKLIGIHGQGRAGVARKKTDAGSFNEIGKLAMNSFTPMQALFAKALACIASKSSRLNLFIAPVPLFRRNFMAP